MKQKTKSQGFTLIELLVVIAILAILAGLLFPAMTSVLRKGKESKMRADMKGIETAVKAYYSEYSKLPIPKGDHGKTPDIKYTKNREIMMSLTGADEKTNPRKIPFLEVPGTEQVFLSPFGGEYGLYLDTDYDNEINLDDLGTNILAKVLVFCVDSQSERTYYSIIDLEQ